MRCFCHQDKEAVGVCKSCGKGVCLECAVDLGKGLACGGRCEDSVRAIIQLVDRNIQLATGATKAQWVVPGAAQPAAPSVDHVATRLSIHIRETRHFRRGVGAFYLLIGVILVVAGVLKAIVALDIVGACFIGFGIIYFVQEQRSAKQPKLPETQTR